MDYPANDWREDKCDNCGLASFLCNLLQDIVYEEDTTKRRKMAVQFREEATNLLDQHSAHLVERDSTFLGNIYGVPINAETKDEVLVKAINKYLQEATGSEKMGFNKVLDQAIDIIKGNK